MYIQGLAMIRIGLLCLVLLPAYCFSQTTQPTDDQNHMTKSYFVAPNEEYPQDAKPIFRRAIEGAYVSVGTERGFIAAANATNISHLILVDTNPGVVQFNQINVALLKISKTREEYLKLRTHPRLSEWTRALNKAREKGYISSAESEYTRNSFSKWKELMAENTKFKSFHAKINNDRRFKGTNYLYDNKLFSKVQKMAKDNKIVTSKAELGSQNDVRNLSKTLQKIDVPISVLDISNAWQKQFLDPGELSNLISVLEIHTTPDSQLVLTDQMTSFQKGRKTHIPWSYSSYTFKKINQYKNLGTFLQHIYKTKGKRSTGPNLTIRTGSLCGDILRKIFKK